jgi:hypothetical protein
MSMSLYVRAGDVSSYFDARHVIKFRMAADV